MNGYQVIVKNIYLGYLAFSVVLNKRTLVFWDTLDISTKEGVTRAKEYLRGLVAGCFEDPPRIHRSRDK